MDWHSISLASALGQGAAFEDLLVSMFSIFSILPLPLMLMLVSVSVSSITIMIMVILAFLGPVAIPLREVDRVSRTFYHVSLFVYFVLFSPISIPVVAAPIAISKRNAPDVSSRTITHNEMTTHKQCFLPAVATVV